MNILFRPPMRSGGGGAALPTLSSAAVSLFGLQVTRHQILRVSALLTLRTLVSLVELPLHDSVVSYLWSFLFSSAQAGVAFAAVASLLDSGGWAGQLAGKLFSPTDGPFVRLYARAVVVIGPCCALFESAVIVYECMRVARLAEDAMFDAERNRQAAWPRRMLVCFAISLVVANGTVLWTVSRMLGPNIAGLGVAATVAAVATGVLSNDGNVVEAGMIALFASLVGVVGIVEELALPSPFLKGWLGAQLRVDPVDVLGLHLHGEEVRAGVLVLTLAWLFVGMGRGRRFLRLLVVGVDALEHEDVSASAASQAPQASPSQAPQQPPPPQQQQAFQQGLPNGVVGGAPVWMGAQPGAKHDVWATVMSTLTLLGATFRLLVWCGQLRSGEYLGGPCRVCQMFASVVLYAMFVQM